MSKILVTGASGFIGKRLVLTLLEEGHEVYALSRVKLSEEKANLHLIQGDLRKDTLVIPKEIEVAYYLVHSMSDKADDLVKTEKEVVEHFLRLVPQVKQIIYLGGIINDETTLSPHLKGRLAVEKALKESGIPTTILRASIIIGAKSASFEIIRDLCEKLPLMIAPSWVKTKCQPIAVSDVLFYLSHVLLNEAYYGKTYDIGGEDVLTFKELMLRYSAFRGLRRWIIDIPVLTPRLSSYWLVFVTSTPFSLCAYLVESMKSSSVVKLGGILSHRCLSYEEALAAVFEDPAEGCFVDRRKALIHDSKEATIERIWNLGGDTGYHALNWAWRLRGFLDQLVGGIGLNRGRRHPTEIEVGDTIDFWQVLQADKNEGHLLLQATMKMPGEARLEFKIEQDHLIQTATFRPLGLLGRLYWYALYPFHAYIFSKMASKISHSPTG